MAALVRELVQQTRAELEDAGQLPDDACYHFDSADPQPGERPPRVEKTRCRTVTWRMPLSAATKPSAKTVMAPAARQSFKPWCPTVPLTLTI